jgi:hypothetical protein
LKTFKANGELYFRFEEAKPQEQ